MDWKYLFLSFEGRITRKPYWIGILILLAVMVVASGIIFGALPSIAAGSQATTVISVIAFFGIIIPVFYASLALAAKRLHDREKSAWWLVLFYLVPAVLDGAAQALSNATAILVLTLIGAAISIWALIELGFLKGTQGPNRFGPDPLGAAQTDASF